MVLTLNRRPPANAHREIVIKTLRHEALDWLPIFGERQLRLVLREYIDHNCQRSHLAIDLRPSRPAATNGSGPVLRKQRLRGFLQRIPSRRLNRRRGRSPADGRWTSEPGPPG